MEDTKKEKKKKKIKLPIIPIIIIILIVIAVISFTSGGGKEITKVKSMLTDVTNKSDLKTASITYNVIAKECEKEGCDKNSNNIKNFKYVVSCKGTLTANIDFSKIQVDFIKEDNTYKIKIPEVTISDDVQLGDRSFIKGENTSPDDLPNILKLCEDTIKEKAKADNKLLPAAREQAIVVLDNYYGQLIKSYNKANNTDYKYDIVEVKNEN